MLDNPLLKMILQGGPKEGADVLDMIIGEGAIQDLPRFLTNALGEIVYRFKQTAMWSDDNDIRLYIPRKYSVEFAYTWTGYFLGSPSEIETRQMIKEGAILIDGANVSVSEGLSDIYYLAVVRVGPNELIKWDSISSRWLFRAPWAMAGYEVTI